MAEFVEDIEPLVTRCPECGTRFRVTEAQLQVAGGRVRCGSCLTVFFGTDHLQWDLEAAPADADPDETLDQLLREIDVFEAGHAERLDVELVPPEPMAGMEPEAAPESVAIGEQPAAEPIQSSAVDDAAEEPRLPLAGTSVDGADVTADAVELLPAQSPQDQAPGDVADFHPSNSPDDIPQEAIAEAIVGEQSGSPEPAALPDRFAQLWQDDGDEAASPGKVGRTTPDGGASAAPDIRSIDREGRSASAGVDPFAEPETAAQTGGTGGEVPSATDDGRATVALVPPRVRPEDILVPADNEAQPKRPRRWLRLVVIPAALLLLAVQGAWYFFPGWAADPAMRWLPERVCNALGCTLEPLRDLEQLLITDVVVRGDHASPRERLVNLLMVNTAPFDQAFPDIEVAFRSPGGDLVAWKRFTPADYLSGDLLASRLIPAKTPVRVELRIEDPGTQAYGYEISLK